MVTLLFEISVVRVIPNPAANVKFASTALASATPSDSPTAVPTVVIDLKASLMATGIN